MRQNRLSAQLIVLSLAIFGCGSDTPTGTGSVDHLTEAQASALMTRITQLAPVHPELSWLADSADLVLRSGAEVDIVNLNTDLGTGPFYAVGLQRAVVNPSNSFGTFDIIIFNDPSNPTDFIIVDGYASGTGTTPPQTASGSFGGQTVNAHLFKVVGNTVSAWRAQTGTATLSTGTLGDACPGFPTGPTVSCAQSQLLVDFAIDVARHDNGVQPTDTRYGQLLHVAVPGIRLHFH